VSLCILPGINNNILPSPTAITSNALSKTKFCVYQTGQCFVYRPLILMENYHSGTLCAAVGAGNTVKPIWKLLQ
jgi:hypothetical protein